MKFSKIILINALCATLFVSSLIAGVYMQGTTKDAKGKTEQMEMFAQKDKLLFKTVGEMGEYTFIYRDDLKKAWMVNDGKYMEWTQEDMKQMGQQMDDAMKMMEEQTKGLTDEQKKLMQQYMKGKMPNQMNQAPEADKIEWKKVGDEKVNEWETAKFQSNKGETVWTIDPKKVGLTKDDFHVFDSAHKFFAESMKDKDSFFKYTSLDNSDGLTGFPVKSESTSGDEYLVNKIVKKDLDDGLFELKDEWEKQAQPGMKMR